MRVNHYIGIMIIFFTLSTNCYGFVTDTINILRDNLSEVEWITKAMKAVDVLSELKLIQSEQKEEIEKIHGYYKIASNDSNFNQYVHQQVPWEYRSYNEKAKRVSSKSEDLIGWDIYEEVVSGIRSNMDQVPDLNQKGREELQIQQQNQTLEAVVSSALTTSQTARDMAKIREITEQRFQESKDEEERIEALFKKGEKKDKKGMDIFSLRVFR